MLLEASWNPRSDDEKSLRTDEDQVPTRQRLPDPIMTYNLDISQFITQSSYFGFAALTGSSMELNCILRCNLTVEIPPGGKGPGVSRQLY
ncbi:hypothetical protein MLD38_028735 [Melastoma candidum]|uniref:Uncharacterized protein n=1 Tax=Melastoma candidum TaxID=119954 RepID=A0ACB9N1M6_9MYRT|nr:hypothetical protein MLD38_028735 [Melastoma candidum]